MIHYANLSETRVSQLLFHYFIKYVRMCRVERWVIYGAEAELQVWGTDCSAPCSIVVSAFSL